MHATQVLQKFQTAEAPPKLRTPEDILSAAAHVIEEFGWLQGQYGDVGRGFCVSGAIAYAITGKPVANGGDHGGLPYSEAMHVLAERVGTKWTPIPSFGSEHNVICWNDTPGRTKGEVLSLLLGK